MRRMICRKWGFGVVVLLVLVLASPVLGQNAGIALTPEEISDSGVAGIFQSAGTHEVIIDDTTYALAPFNAAYFESGRRMQLSKVPSGTMIIFTVNDKNEVAGVMITSE